MEGRIKNILIKLKLYSTIQSQTLYHENILSKIELRSKTIEIENQPYPKIYPSNGATEWVLQ